MKNKHSYILYAANSKYMHVSKYVTYKNHTYMYINLRNSHIRAIIVKTPNMNRSNIHHAMFTKFKQSGGHI